MSTPDIFYVEDDTDFAFIMENAVQEVSNGLSIRIIENGKDALEALKQLGTPDVTCLISTDDEAFSRATSWAIRLRSPPRPLRLCVPSRCLPPFSLTALRQSGKRQS